MSGLLSARLAAAALLAFATAFAGVNLGLRLLPEGRVLLSRARARGRLFAGPGGATPGVRAVFALAWLLALIVGVASFLLMTPDRLTVPVPRHYGPLTAEHAR